MQKERLDKLLAGQGMQSRREVQALIRSGRVLVDGKPARPEQKIGPENAILVDNQPLLIQKNICLMLNKPGGVLSATRDRHTKTVLDLVPPALQRKGLFPAGRLDKDTEGLLLLTDDGQLAHRMLSPKNKIPKVYRLTLDQAPDNPAALIDAFAHGLDLGGGDSSSPAQLRFLGDDLHAEVIIYEGVYHQVKRMFALFSLAVVALRRIQIGGLTLDPALAPGECRPLTDAEISSLFAGSAR